MHTRAAVAVFGAEASNKTMTGKVTTNRGMSCPFPLPHIGTRGLCRSMPDRSFLKRAITDADERSAKVAEDAVTFLKDEG
jgi:hypothetical protein